MYNVSPWITKNGRRIFISRPTGISSSNIRISTTNDHHDSSRAHELAEFAEQVRHRYEEQRLDISSAKTLVKSSVLVFSIVDPHFATAYTAFKFTEYCYAFISRIKEEYGVTGNLSDAVLNVLEFEIREKIIPYLRIRLIRKVAEIITEELWDKFTKENLSLKWQLYLENTIKQSMVETIYDSLDKVI